MKDLVKIQQEAFLEMQQTIQLLHLDVAYCLGHLDDDEADQFWRRAYTRAMFAQVEGVIFCMKRIAFAYRFAPGVGFSVGELMIVLEKSYKANEKGEAEEQRMQVSLRSNIKFAFSAFARANQAIYKLRIDDHRWQDFSDGIKVRDRLMHPKKETDLTVSNNELESLMRAYDWFTECTVEVSELALEKTMEYIKRGLTKEQAEALDQALGSLESNDPIS